MLNYDNFITIKYNEKVYNNMFLEFFNYFYNSDLLSINERINIDNEMTKLNENFYDILKSRYDKAKDVVKNFNTDAKNALEKIIDISKDATDFVKNLLNNITNSIKNILNKSKLKIIEKIKSSNEIISKIKEIKDKNAILKEIKDSAALIKFYNEKFTQSLVKMIQDAFSKLLSSNEQPVIEKNIDLFQNPKNVISKLIHHIESVPPFSWLDNVKDIGEKNANKVFNLISDFTKKLGGPALNLPIVAGLLGVVLENEIKSYVKQGLIDMIAFYSIPFVSILIKVVGWIATLISLILVIDMTLELHILSHSKDLHPTHTPTPIP